MTTAYLTADISTKNNEIKAVVITILTSNSDLSVQHHYSSAHPSHAAEAKNPLINLSRWRLCHFRRVFSSLFFIQANHNPALCGPCTRSPPPACGNARNNFLHKHLLLDSSVHDPFIVHNIIITCRQKTGLIFASTKLGDDYYISLNCNLSTATSQDHITSLLILVSTFLPRPVPPCTY